MGRVIGSIVLGYVVIFLAVFGLMTASWVVLGPAGAFQPGSWEVTGLWNGLMLAAGLIAAVVGGYLCATVSRDMRGPKGLIGVVIVLGILFALPVLSGTPPATGPRPDSLPMFEAMANGIQPVWVALLNPLLGAVGVWWGASRRRGGSAA